MSTGGLFVTGVLPEPSGLDLQMSERFPGVAAPAVKESCAPDGDQSGDDENESNCVT
jgi:hypothetical protein